MSDIIDRQKVVDALIGLIPFAISDEATEAYSNGLTDAYNLICQLPSAQPERKKGKWIYSEDEYGTDGYRCDKCGFFVPWDYVHKFINYIEDYNFCPHCDADMRWEEQDE